MKDNQKILRECFCLYAGGGRPILRDALKHHVPLVFHKIKAFQYGLSREVMNLFLLQPRNRTINYRGHGY